MVRAIAATVFMLLVTAATRAQYIRPDVGPEPTGIGPTYIEIDGQVYGAVPSELGPIGGGRGYTRIVTSGDYNVRGIDDLRAALSQAKPGETVWVDPSGDYDVTAMVFAEEFVMEIPEGVILASDRGHEGSVGAVLYSDAYQTSPMIRVMGSGVRITGLWLRGPSPKQHLEHHRRAFTRHPEDRNRFRFHDGEGVRGGHPYYYRLPTSQAVSCSHDNLEVDNCRISGWTRGIFVVQSSGHHIHHNYIHHNRWHGLGYGVSHNTALTLIEFNLFDANRHSLAGTGRPGEGYEARHNVELYVTSSFPFDMHGGRDRRDGTDIAGTRLKITNNQFRATSHRAIGIRGRPEEMSHVNHNWFYHQMPGPRVMMPWPCGGDTNVTFENNAFGREAPRVDPDVPEQ